MIQALNCLELRLRLQRKPDEHKGNAGKVLLLGGAPGMAGAIFLSAYGSLYSGAGWTILGVLDPQSAHMHRDQPELMVQDISQTIDPSSFLDLLKPDSLAIGPGLGFSNQARHFLEACIRYPAPLVMDADALNLLATSPELEKQLSHRDGPCTLTPHPGEAGRLLGITANDVQSDRLTALQTLMDRFGCSIVLKGHHTLVGSPAGITYRCQEGNAGMATGGMGDVLTGLIAALAAQGIHHQLTLWEATCLGVQLHALAADRLVQSGIGPIGMTPLELAKTIRTLINQI
jgi:hydroxyethylthiazole kinase-like uncharacterized protein yjeF